MAKERITRSISFPDAELLEDAKALAERKGISFSTLVNQLIRKELGKDYITILKANEDPADYRGTEKKTGKQSKDSKDK